jgi:hypothetical protein
METEPTGDRLIVGLLFCISTNEPSYSKAGNPLLGQSSATKSEAQIQPRAQASEVIFSLTKSRVHRLHKAVKRCHIRITFRSQRENTDFSTPQAPSRAARNRGFPSQ